MASTEHIISQFGACDKDGYPQWWPNLKEGDIGSGTSFHGDGSPCCLAGWIQWASRGYKVELAIQSGIKQVLKVRGHGEVAWISLVNDDYLSPLQRAEVWSEAGVVLRGRFPGLFKLKEVQ